MALVTVLASHVPKTSVANAVAETQALNDGFQIAILGAAALAGLGSLIAVLKIKQPK